MKRLAAVTCILLVIVAIALCGCGTEQFTIQDGVLMVGAEIDPPWLIKSGNSYTGFGADVLSQVAGKLGLTVKYAPSTMPTRVEGLNANQFDVAGSPAGIFPANSQKMGLTTPVATTGRYVVVLKKSSVKSLADLNGKVVGVLARTSDDVIAKGIAGLKEVKALPEEEQLFAALDNGTVDAILTVTPEYTYRNKDGEKYVGVVTIGGSLSWAFAVKKGNKNLLDQLNSALKQMKSDGSLKKLQEKWLGGKP